MKQTHRVLAIAVTLAMLLTGSGPAAHSEAVPLAHETDSPPSIAGICDEAVASSEPQADAPDAAYAEIGADAGDSPVDDAESPVDDADSPVDDADSPIDDGDGTVDDADSPVDDGDSPVDDGDSPVDDGDAQQPDRPDIPAARLPAPAELAITEVTNDLVRFSFRAVDGACGYRLYYSTESSFNPSYSRVDADADSLTAEVDCLVPGQRYCFWIAALDSAGTLGNESAMVSATTGAVSLTVGINAATVSNREILDWAVGQPLTVACTASNGNGKYLVKAYVTSAEPAFDKSDMDLLATGVANDGTGFYYGSEDGPDKLPEDTAEALPFDFSGCAAGQYVKIWIAVEDANYSTNGYRDSIQFAIRLKNAGSSMDWSCWLTSTSVQAGGMVCVKLKADRVRSFFIEIDGTGVYHNDVFDAGVRNRLASVCLRVPEDTPDGLHTVTVLCSESYSKNDPNTAKEIRRLEFTVGDLPLNLSWPLRGDYMVGQHFGARDVSNKVSNASTGHNGIDIRASGGTKIYAAAAGTVVRSTYSSSSGNWVQIAHANGVSTVYKHLKKRSALRVGDAVEAGDLVGYVGSTGIASGNHLHFGVLLNGDPVDPLSGYIMPNSVRTINFYTLK